MLFSRWWLHRKKCAAETRTLVIFSVRWCSSFTIKRNPKYKYPKFSQLLFSPFRSTHQKNTWSDKHIAVIYVTFRMLVCLFQNIVLSIVSCAKLTTKLIIRVVCSIQRENVKGDCCSSSSLWWFLLLRARLSMKRSVFLFCVIGFNNLQTSLI